MSHRTRERPAECLASLPLNYDRSAARCTRGGAGRAAGALSKLPQLRLTVRRAISPRTPAPPRLSLLRPRRGVREPGETARAFNNLAGIGSLLLKLTEHKSFQQTDSVHLKRLNRYRFDVKVRQGEDDHNAPSVDERCSILDGITFVVYAEGSPGPENQLEGASKGAPGGVPRSLELFRASWAVTAPVAPATRYRSRPPTPGSAPAPVNNYCALSYAAAAAGRAPPAPAALGDLHLFNLKSVDVTFTHHINMCYTHITVSIIFIPLRT
ncbi:hypothetical protein EVAR_50211_1 [Eumeta japonica]|uniref:Uncharacterized protein n=1 Tax=Eumeta variegata TaxID=151549 RepID=A0A4C1X0G1_EUMVA|nr:hypothetical protein EVAR_50211_1 [Eumeta japonica]